MAENEKAAGKMDTVVRLIDTPKAERTAVISVMLLGLILRVENLSENGLNSAEIYNYLWAKDSLVSRLAGDIAPPLYPLLTKPFLWLGPEWGARSVSITAGLAFCYLIWMVARRAFGKPAGLLALAFCAGAPQLVWISRVGLGHQLAATMTALMLYSFAGMTSGESKRQPWIFTGAAVAGFYSNYYISIVVLFFLVLGMIYFFIDRNKSKKLILHSALAIMFFIPMIVSFYLHTDQVDYAKTTPAVVNGPVQFIFMALSAFNRLTPAVALGFIGNVYRFLKHILLIVAGVLFVFSVLGAKKKNKGQPKLHVLLGLFVFADMLVLLIHWFYRAPLDMYSPSFLMAVTLPLIATACLWPKSKIASGFLIVTMILFNVLIFIFIPNSLVGKEKQITGLTTEMAGKTGLVIRIADYHSDPFRVYGGKEIDSVNVPGDLREAPPAYGIGAEGVQKTDALEFKKLIKNYDRIVVLVVKSRSGINNKSLWWIRDWIIKSGFEKRRGNLPTKFTVNEYVRK